MVNTLIRLGHLRDCMILQKNRKTAYGKFSMANWLTGSFEWGTKITVKRFKECGTSACAFGYASFYPPLRKLGIAAMFTAMGSYTIVQKGKFWEGINYQIVGDCFGISEGEAIEIFRPGRYTFGTNLRLSEDIKPHHVIKKIDKLIKKYRRTL